MAFAAFSLRLSTKPAGPTFLYGYERITFFSAGFEGALIILAAIAIAWHASPALFAPPPLVQLDLGIALVLTTALINAALGLFLIRTGKRTDLDRPVPSG